MKLGEFNMLPIGAVLNNRYKITEQLGNHGYKYDYKAIDGKTQCMCVVSEFYMHSILVRECGEKEIQLPHSQRLLREYEYSKGRFVESAKLAGRVCNNPNILSTYDVFCENNTAYCVTESVEAMDLELHIRKNGCLAEDEIRYIARCLCRALDELHKKSILHLRIVPENILICTDRDAYENVKLIVDGGCWDKNTVRDMHVCTMYPGYCPPEGYGRCSEAGTWSDVYMLGAVMYKMATGIRPDESTNRFIHDDTKLPHELNPQISEKLSKIIMRAIELKRRKRYCRIAQLMRELSK